MLTTDDHLTTTNTGLYRGIINGKVQAFKGIRYALPPTGELRFCPPVPVPPSDKIIDALSYSPVSFQPGYFSKLNGKDSLTLNIWRNIEADGKSPVLFFIHGGCFVRGSGQDKTVDGTILARDLNVVVVTINYRLGPFGFLDFSSLDSNYIANPGLHDIILALKWVHKNIKAFGGDPNNITVAGASAGGSVASLLPTIDEAALLINRLFLISGIPTSFIPDEEEALLVEHFLEHYKIKNHSDLCCLTDEHIVSETPAFMNKCGLGASTFSPVIDKQFIRTYPINMINNGLYKPMPILIGCTGDELSVLKYKFGRKSWDLRKVINKGLSGENEHLISYIRSLYEKKYEKRQIQTQLMSDMIFRSANLFYAEAVSADRPVWLYRFDYSPLFMRLSGFDAVHSSDLPFVFGNLREGVGKLMFSLTPRLAAVRKLSKEMQNDLLAFLKNGSLPWSCAFSEGYKAKIYDLPIRYDEPVPFEIYEAYQKTKYYALNKKKIFTIKSERQGTRL